MAKNNASIKISDNTGIQSSRASSMAEVSNTLKVNSLFRQTTRKNSFSTN